MRTDNQANIEQNLNRNTLVRQSPLRRRVAWLTLAAYIGQPMIVTAQVIADPAAAANKRPVIDTTANGTPLVQIATPNAAGVSHNQYTQFNVDPAGLILNNSPTTVLTQQAGYIAGNQNLANGAAASLILNEVTSTSRSQLNGYIEVAGPQAQVIVANPNGITCNGCGFINTSRGVLTTGTPVLGIGGSLDSLRVTGGDIQIGMAGLNAGNISQLDLIARSVQVNGQLWAGNLNVVTGANLVNYSNLGVQIIAGDANKPTVGIDIALLGGMYANKIRLVGTEAGVGVNSLGNLSAQAGDFSLDNQGQITLNGSTTASGNLTVNSNTGITNNGTIYSQQAAQITTTGDINNTGRIAGNTVETHSNNFNNTAAVMGNTLNLYANNLNNLNAAAFIGGTQNVNLIIANALNNQGGATIYSLGDINIGANVAVVPATGYLTGNSISLNNQSATIEAAGNLRIAANTLTNKRTVVGVEWGSSWNGAFVAGNPRYTPTYTNEQFTATTTPAAQLLSGANMWIGGGSLTNDYSSIIAGGTLTTQLATLTNSGAPFRQRTTGSGFVDTVVPVLVGWSCNWIGTNCSPNYVWVTVTSPYTLPTTYTNIPGSVNVTNLQNTQPAGAVSAASQGVLSALAVPTSGLYTTHTQPGQKYLIVTDPRFANYQNFVSSDYMLNRLSLDPQLIQKRLGDGFYEQKLVNDQIAAQTGRRYLGNYTDTQAQFMALLDSGVKAAENFQLTLGIALTPKQIDALSQDIVWMVERDVTLPNGTTERVLAPQLYLSRLHGADLKPTGALIAANNINITASDNLANSGIIQGGASTVLSARDITNQGGVIGSQGFTLLKADNDILNLSGNINGQNVGLAAGRDIVNQRTSRSNTRTVAMGQGRGTGGLFGQAPVMMGTANSTEFGLDASISATNLLSINAGHDLSLIGANIKSGGDAVLNAGRDLNAGVLTTTNSSTTAQYAVSSSNVTQLGSHIQTGGNLQMKAGNDMRLTSTTLNVGQDATLIAGGDLTLAASKNSSQSSFDSGAFQQRNYDETVVGTTLNAGGNITLAAKQAASNNDNTVRNNGIPRQAQDSRGNVTLQSASVTSKNGNLNVIADGNVDIKTMDENHDSFSKIQIQSSGLFTTTKRTTSNASWRTDNIGSNLSADNISITSGKNIGITGSAASAEHNINVAAMGDVNISAATNTYGSDYYSHETTTGLQFGSGGNPFSLTDSGPDITKQAHTDGTKQSYNRSSLTSNSGNLNIMSGGNLIAGGADLAAHAGSLALTAGGAVALLAGQDTLNQSSSTLIVTNPNAFTKQHHTITDTYASLDYQGSTAQANSIKISSGADTLLQAAQVTSGAGGITINAAGDLKLLAAVNSSSNTHTETLSTDGMAIKADGTPNDLATRRINNKAESQTQTNQVTRLVSSGDITTHSGGDTLIEASQLNAQGAIALSATGYAATTNADGSTNAGRDGKITFAAVKDNTYTSVTNSNNSFAWQNANGGGEYVDTLKLANISAGKGLSVNATGGVVIDIPAVPATPAPAPTRDTNGPSTGSGQAKLIPVVPLTPEQQAAQRQADLNHAIQNLASQPGQAWIGQLANDPKVQVQWNQVQTAVQHWNYAHDGLTQEAVVVIAIVVAYFTAGAGSSMVGTTTAVEGGAAGATATTIGGTTLATTATTAAGVSVTTYTVAGAVINAGFTALASEAAVSFANNKGDIGKTLNDMGQSRNVRNVVAAMLTAGASQYLTSYNVTNLAAKIATGCAAGTISGAGCNQGATSGAVTDAAAWTYNSLVGYNANAGPGNTPAPNKDYPFYQSINGQQPLGSVGNNVVGLNDPASANSFWAQGSAFSNDLNKIPFINATAGLHDYIFNSGALQFNTLNNLGTMIPALMVAVPASLNAPSLIWLTTYKLPSTGK